MPHTVSNRNSFGKGSEHSDPFIGMKLVPLSRAEALCFVSTYDKPFLLSKLAGVLTVHDCDIVEADVDIRGGVVTDLFKIRTPIKYEPALLEAMLIESLRKVLTGETNIEKEIFLWEKRRAVIREQIVTRFKTVKDNLCILTVNTSNRKGLLHKISWALSLGGMNIEKAIISTKQDMKVEDVFWIKHRQGEKITPQYKEKLRDLLEVIVSEGADPLDQVFKKEINMIYRQQLERRASGLRTAQLYADVHLRLLKGLFDRVKLELDIQDAPILIGVYGGIGSGTIGFTSDIDCIFLYDGEKREEYDNLKRILKNEFKRISGLDVDESFLPCHINYFYLGSYEGESPVSFDDFFNYINYIAKLRNETNNRLFEPQFFHFPWAFSLRFVGNKEVLGRFRGRIRKLSRGGNGKYSSLKAYVLREKGDEIKKDYVAYLKGKYFPRELDFFNIAKLRNLYRQRAYQEFIESIVPYDAIKFVFRRGVFPLLYIVHNNGHRTDMGLLRKENLKIRLAIDFMLKAFNVRKTLFIMGQWDLNYFFYIMDSKSEREFCKRYLNHQKKIAEFVGRLVNKG